MICRDHGHVVPCGECAIVRLRSRLAAAERRLERVRGRVEAVLRTWDDVDRMQLDDLLWYRLVAGEIRAALADDGGEEGTR
jgi:hypothetical protein